MSSYWRRQGSSPWRIIIPSAGQIEESSHSDPYVSCRGALRRNSWLCWTHKHGFSLLWPDKISSPLWIQQGLIWPRSLYSIYLSCQQALESKFLRMDKPVCCQVGLIQHPIGFTEGFFALQLTSSAKGHWDKFFNYSGTELFFRNAVWTAPSLHCHSRRKEQGAYGSLDWSFLFFGGAGGEGGGGEAGFKIFQLWTCDTFSKGMQCLWKSDI